MDMKDMKKWFSGADNNSNTRNTEGESAMTTEKKVVEIGVSIIVHQSEGLPAIERCDRCSAHAQVKAFVLNQEEDLTELLFCTHHGTKHWSRLIEIAQTIHDHRPWLETQERDKMKPASV